MPSHQIHHLKDAPLPGCDCNECLTSDSWPTDAPGEQLEKPCEAPQEDLNRRAAQSFKKTRVAVLLCLDAAEASAKTKEAVKLCLDTAEAHAKTREAVKLCLEEKVALEVKAREAFKDA
jgi:hypothetical protein